MKIKLNISVEDIMTEGQFNRASCLRKRIYELKVMRNHLNDKWEKIKIADFEIPKNSRDVILALCEKEISDLEKEFENL